jgi:hypothetical protein
MELSNRIVSDPNLLCDPDRGCMLRLYNNNYRLAVFLIESILENTFYSFCCIPLMPEPASQTITQVYLLNIANQLRHDATEADKIP